MFDNYLESDNELEKYAFCGNCNIGNLPLNVKIVLEENSKEYGRVAQVSVKKMYEEESSHELLL